MADTIAQLPPAALPLAPTAKLEVQVGTGPGSSQHVEFQDIFGGGGGLQWRVASTASNLVADEGVIVTAASDHTLPSPLEATKQYVVHAKVNGVRIVSNGNVITGVGAGNNLLLAAGETAHLVASSTNTLEVV